MPRHRGFESLRRVRADDGQRGLIWQAMRVLRRFTRGDLETTCEGIDRSSLELYLVRLRRAGYLRVVATRPKPNGGLPTNVYQLVRDTGPRAPIVWVQKQQVCDQNTGDVFDARKPA